MCFCGLKAKNQSVLHHSLNDEQENSLCYILMKYSLKSLCCQTIGSYIGTKDCLGFLTGMF